MATPVATWHCHGNFEQGWELVEEEHKVEKEHLDPDIDRGSVADPTPGPD